MDTIKVEIYLKTGERIQVVTTNTTLNNMIEKYRPLVESINDETSVTLSLSDNSATLFPNANIALVRIEKVNEVDE